MPVRIFTLSFLLLSGAVFSQTGPAGVGTSANNVLWLKADAGTSTTIAGGAVSGWQDQSGNGLGVSQPLAIQQPLYQPNIINGLPAILFDNDATAGQNDKLIGPDSPLHDNTAGYTFFTVTRLQNMGCNSIISKRVDVSIHQSFMLFFWTGDRVHVDIQTTDDRFTSSTTFSPNNNYLIDMIYDGSLPAAQRSKLYVGETLNRTAYETNSSVPDNVSQLVVGSTHLTDPRPFAGYIAEIIMYREALNKASRIIVNNHLSAKYNLPLGANDYYAGDLPANGDYDFDVAGIGTDTIQPSGTTGSNTAFAGSATKGMGMTQVSGFQAGDYILAGHKTPLNSAINSDVAGLSGSAPSRWSRIWYVDVTNSGPSTVVNIEFDMTAGGVSPVLGNAGDYFLLYRASQTGAWTPLSPASSVTASKILFNNYTLTNDGYYTIGTVDYMASPLPVELLAFTAEKSGKSVLLNWQTASENDSDYFSVEHSADGQSWNEIDRKNAAGNSAGLIAYTSVHHQPLTGVNYYRLKQVDTDGDFRYSEVRAVDFEQEENVVLFPNPANENLTVMWKDSRDHEIQLMDYTGRILYTTTASGSIQIPLGDYSAGKYLIRTEEKILPFVKL